MNGRTNFAHRIDMWNDDGETIVEQLAGIDDWSWPWLHISLRSSDGRRQQSPFGRVLGSSRTAGSGECPLDEGGHGESVAVSAVRIIAASNQALTGTNFAYSMPALTVIR